MRVGQGRRGGVPDHRAPVHLQGGPRATDADDVRVLQRVWPLHRGAARRGAVRGGQGDGRQRGRGVLRDGRRAGGRRERDLTRGAEVRGGPLPRHRRAPRALRRDARRAERAREGRGQGRHRGGGPVGG